MTKNLVFQVLFYWQEPGLIKNNYCTKATFWECLLLTDIHGGNAKGFDLRTYFTVLCSSWAIIYNTFRFTAAYTFGFEISFYWQTVLGIRHNYILPHSIFKTPATLCVVYHTLRFLDILLTHIPKRFIRYTRCQILATLNAYRCHYLQNDFKFIH